MSLTEKMRGAVVDSFAHECVRLLPSLWERQQRSLSEWYMRLSEDDVLYGFRRSANLPAPGKALDGWCRVDASVVFGQWLSGMVRLGCGRRNGDLIDKALRLMDGWSSTVGEDGRLPGSESRDLPYHYHFDKFVGALADLVKFARSDSAVLLLRRMVGAAYEELGGERVPASAEGYPDGYPLEWYTLAENLYRAYRLTGEEPYRTLAQRLHYDEYWDRFVESDNPGDVAGRHAYSHLNTFSSAAMAYVVEGDMRWLTILKNAFDFFQASQCYATGGFGPAERILGDDGGLGLALDTRSDSFEASCGSWAVFKLASYLVQFTGNARYLDWAERVLYNGIGAALWLAEEGRHFYYADYRPAGGLKVYHQEPYTCCSGTYGLSVSEYNRLIYFKDDCSLYVGLYLPSVVSWHGPTGDVEVRQETRFPDEGKVRLIVKMDAERRFKLKLRIPGWATCFNVKVNDVEAACAGEERHWWTIERDWADGDVVTVEMPLEFRAVPVDRYHVDRVAVVRGPIVYVCDAGAADRWLWLPTDEALSAAVHDSAPSSFALFHQGRQLRSKLRPFYSLPESYRYRMYFDMRHPVRIW
jgi:uncharacterized protein